MCVCVGGGSEIKVTGMRPQKQHASNLPPMRYVKMVTVLLSKPFREYIVFMMLSESPSVG